jgi:hypothetical protein
VVQIESGYHAQKLGSDSRFVKLGSSPAAVLELGRANVLDALLPLLGV